MTKNWEKTGYLIPENIDPDENICICVPIPKDWGHIRAFMGQLTELSKWITWEKTGGTEAAQAARRWFDITECVQEAIECAMSDGCGCGASAAPTNTRINHETGEYEVSYDGGVTWIPAPQLDPRFSGTVFPPISGTPGTAMRCEGANSVVSFLEDMQAVELAQLEANATVADTIVAVLAALSALGIFLAAVPAAVFALVSFVVGLFAHLIPEDFDNQFTSDTWDELLCIVYCSIQSDGSFREIDWLHVKNECLSEIGGYAGNWLAEHINMIGIVGLTNAARAHYPGTRDCETCECNSCTTEAQIVVGTFVSRTETRIVVDAVLTTYNSIFAYWVVFGDWETGTCCLLCEESYSPGISSGGWSDCDGVAHDGTSPNGQEIGQIRAYSTAGAFTATYKMFGDEDCPPI